MKEKLKLIYKYRNDFWKLVSMVVLTPMVVILSVNYVTGKVLNIPLTFVCVVIVMVILWLHYMKQKKKAREYVYDADRIKHLKEEAKKLDEIRKESGN